MHLSNLFLTAILESRGQHALREGPPRSQRRLQWRESCSFVEEPSWPEPPDDPPIPRSVRLLSVHGTQPLVAKSLRVHHQLSEANGVHPAQRGEGRLHPHPPGDPVDFCNDPESERMPVLVLQ